MKLSLVKGVYLGGAALLMSAALAQAQQADQQSLAVGIDVQTTQPALSLTGLQDVVLSSDGSTAIIQNVQTFCAFTPGQFINMIISGTETSSISGATVFAARDATQTGVAEYLTYEVSVNDAFSGSGAGLGSGANGVFQNAVAETNIDTNLFNTDATCSDGENLSLTIQINLQSGVNRVAIPVISDGQLHSYSDTLTILIEPFL